MIPRGRPGGIQRALATTIREHCAWDWEGRGLIGGRTVWMRSMSTPRSLPDGTTVWDGVIVDTTANRQGRGEDPGTGGVARYRQ